MADRLPPLQSLRAFEAAGRHVSFRAAADELAVTPSAVSHAVKTLEDFLGVKLFHRKPRQLMLTDAGRAYLPRLRDAFALMTEATREVSARERSDLLTIGSMPSFARVWLMPKLQSFLSAHPDIDLRLLVAVAVVDLVENEVDAGIVYGQGNWPGFTVEQLVDETLLPACSPALLDRLREPADLARHTLIHTETKPTTWEMWLGHVGHGYLKGQRELRFNRSTLALEAAVQGLGVALDSATLIRPYLEAGTLVAPFEAVLSGAEAGGYYLIHAEDKARLPKFQAFRSWILQKARENG